MGSPQHVWCLMGGFLMQALSDVHLNKSVGIQAKLSHQIQDPLHTLLLLSGIFYTLVPPHLGLEHAGSISIIAPTQWRHLSWVRSVHGCIAFRKLHRWHLESFRYRGTMNLSVSHLNPVYKDSQIHPWATLKRSKRWGFAVFNTLFHLPVLESVFLTLFCHLWVKVHMAARDHTGRSLLRRCTQAFAASAIWHLPQDAVGLVLRDWWPKLDHALKEADVCFTTCAYYPPFDSKPCTPMATPLGFPNKTDMALLSPSANKAQPWHICQGHEGATFG